MIPNAGRCATAYPHKESSNNSSEIPHIALPSKLISGQAQGISGAKQFLIYMLLLLFVTLPDDTVNQIFLHCRLARISRSFARCNHHPS